MRLLQHRFSILLVFVVLSISCGDDDPVAPTDDNAPEPLTFNRFHEAAVVIGQVGMTSMGPNTSTPDVGPQGFDTPASVAAGSVSGPLFVVDYDNNRVLGFAGIPTSNGAMATFVLGQTDFVSNTGNATSRTLRQPLACTVANGELYVVDYGNNRVLVWKSLPTATNAAAQVVMGQDNFTDIGAAVASDRFQEPTGVAVAGGKVFVADRGNHRVLIWNSIPSSNGEGADVVVGQPNMDTRNPGLSQTELFNPNTLWTDGRRLIVGDSEHKRVLIWNSIPTQNGEPADVVVGAPDFDTDPSSMTASATTIRGIGGIASDGTSLFVSDSGANRILIFTPIPTENGAAAVNVIGQDSFTADASNDHNQDDVTDSGPTERTLSSPSGIRVVGNRLMIADEGNHRVLIYDSN